MSDSRMPDYEQESTEGDSMRPVVFPRHIDVQIKSYTQRLQAAHTLQALLSVRHDIERGMLANNRDAKGILKRFANQHAREIGFKGGAWW